VVCTLPILQRMAQGKLLRVLATFQKHSSFPGAADATSLGVPELSSIILERLVAAPPRLPSAIQTTLANALSGALSDPSVQKWATDAGANLQARTPGEAMKIVSDQAAFYEKWKSVVDAV
jgi:tripartite-type tricarboxylate transporter receptor subunit TctC